MLATRIEEAMGKNESLESLTVDNVRRDIARARITGNKVMNAKSVQVSRQKNKPGVKAKRAPAPAKSTKPAVTKSMKSSSASSSRKPSSGGKKQIASKKSNSVKSTPSKLSVVGFRGRSAWSNKKDSMSSRWMYLNFGLNLWLSFAPYCKFCVSIFSVFVSILLLQGFTNICTNVMSWIWILSF